MFIQRHTISFHYIAGQYSVSNCQDTVLSYYYTTRQQFQQRNDKENEQTKQKADELSSIEHRCRAAIKTHCAGNA
jgi:hypothetical protein